MKKAFTMLELIFVLVVIGILAAVIMPRLDRDPSREAAIQVLSHIRYTQHLAMMDDKYDSNDTQWYKARWQIFFANDNSGNGNKVYTIFADDNKGGGADIGEVAVDPVSQRLLSGDSLYNNHIDTMNLSKKYGVTNVTFTGGCINESRISFDHLGRPLKGALNAMTSPYGNSKLIQTTCNILLSTSDTNVTIAVEPETGYAHIL